MSTSEQAQNDLKKLKSTYASQLSTLKELFTDWTDDDLVFTLQDADGDLELAIDRISEGHASQWGEVKTKKSKKEAAQAAHQSTPKPQEVSQVRMTTTKLKQRPVRPQPKSWHAPKKEDGWHTSKHQDHWGTPSLFDKKPSQSKTSSHSGAKTWASLLQSTPEPSLLEEEETKNTPTLQKVDDAWLTPSTTSQWGQSTEKSSTNNTTTEHEDSLPDFSKLSLESELKDYPQSTVADLFHSTTTTNNTSPPVTTHTTPTTTTPTTTATTTTLLPEQPTKSQEPIHTTTVNDLINSTLASTLNTSSQQQQQQQQQPYFGFHDYNSLATNLHDYSMYSNNNNMTLDQFQQRPNYQDTHKTLYGQEQEKPTSSYQQQMYNMQSFYPYYYMPNQFNTYHSTSTSNHGYPNPPLNRTTYPTASNTSSYQQTSSSTTTTNTATTSSSYGNASSPYTHSTQSLYGFNDLGLNSGFLSDTNNDKPSTTSPQQQQIYSQYFGQSPMFSYNQPYRSNQSQYWNQS